MKKRLWSAKLAGATSCDCCLRFCPYDNTVLCFGKRQICLDCLADDSLWLDDAADKEEIQILENGE